MTQIPDLHTFIPSEMATVVGVPQTLVRDWRSQGLLPKHPGQARHSAEEVCRIAALATISEHAPKMPHKAKAAELLTPAIRYHWLGKGAAPGGRRLLVTSDGQTVWFDKLSELRTVDFEAASVFNPRAIVQHMVDRMPPEKVPLYGVVHG